MLFFDKLILTTLLLGLFFQIVIIGLYKFRKVGRFFTLFSICLILISQTSLIYGGFIEPHWIEVKQERVILNSAKSDLRLKAVVVSDFHLGPYKKNEFVQMVVDKINNQNPDIVFMLGDYIYSYADQADYLEPIKNIEAKYGVFAVLGNHDYGISRYNKADQGVKGSLQKSDYVAKKLEDFGVTVLRNYIVRIEISNEELIIVGLEDLWGGNVDIEKALEGLDETDNIILLEHNPDIILEEQSRIADLILSGHTHGGQIRLPLFGALSSLPTILNDNYGYGLFEFESGNKLFITKGVGEMGPRARFWCRPEIVILEIGI